MVEKSGDVIPQVVKPIIEKRTGDEKIPKLPKKCPVCGGEVIKPEGEAVARCQNLMCPAQFKRRIQHFAARNAMDIEHLGPETIDKLLDAVLGPLAQLIMEFMEGGQEANLPEKDSWESQLVQLGAEVSSPDKRGSEQLEGPGSAPPFRQVGAF